MTTILQVDFPLSGPWGEAAAGAFADLAGVIGQTPGLQWKIWTENEGEGMSGGIYCFDDEAAARAYMAVHEERLTSFGITNIRALYFDVNSGLTALNNGPV